MKDFIYKMQVNNLNNIKFPPKTKNNYVKVHNSQESISNDNAFMLNNVSFGMNNPQLAFLRAQKLKAEYAKAGLDYLLPNEVWSTKKIMQTIDKVNECYDKILEKRKKVTVEKLNKLVSNFLPKNFSEKIEIKDFKKDFPGFIKKFKYSEKDIKFILENYGGLHVQQNEKSYIFVTLDKDNTNYEEKNYHEAVFIHELKHAITSKATNMTKNLALKLKNLTKISDIFLKLESTFITKPECVDKQMEITEENLYKNLINNKTKEEIKTREGFKWDFFNELESILRKNPDIKEYDLLKYFKCHAKDEKEAYLTYKTLRKSNNKENKPIGLELRSLMYKELEKFFSEAKRYYEKTQCK